jgi:hypothetical protein
MAQSVRHSRGQPWSEHTHEADTPPWLQQHKTFLHVDVCRVAKKRGSELPWYFGSLFTSSGGLGFDDLVL